MENLDSMSEHRDHVSREVETLRKNQEETLEIKTLCRS